MAQATEAIEIEQIATTVKVVDILPGEQPAIIVVKRAVNPEGVARHFTFKVAVPNQALFQCLFAQVQKGDDIMATVVTTWYDDNYKTHLVQFSKANVSAATPVSNLHHDDSN